MLFLSVGQGDCTALVYGEQALLVDAGPSAMTAERAIARRLREEGVTRVRGLLLTHDDSDHVAGAGTLARLYPGMAVWIGPGSRIPVRGPVRRLGAWQRIAFGPYDIVCRYPFSASEDDNPRSALCAVTVEGATLALTGDSPTGTEEGIAEMMPRGAGIYKAGHHGSARSSSAALLARLRPGAVVVSCGVGNRYGHPHPSVLARVAASGAALWRTDRQGDIEAVPDRGGWSVRRLRGSPAMTR